MIKKWGDFIREFVNEPINVDYIKSRMQELKDTVIGKQEERYNDDDFYLEFDWSIDKKTRLRSNLKDTYGQLNINFNSVDGEVKFEFDLDDLVLNISSEDGEDSQKVSSVEEGLDIIEKEIYRYIGLSESVINESISDTLLVAYLLLFLKWKDLTIENLVKSSKAMIVDFAKFLNGYGYPIDINVLENKFDRIVKMATIKAKSDRLTESLDTDLIGKRIRIVRLEDPYTNIKPGDEGVVRGVDDMGHILMKWDNGSSLSIIPEMDEFDVIEENLKRFNESAYDIVFTEKRGTPIIAYQKDVDSDNLSLMDGYYSGTAMVGLGADRGSVDFSSPFHTGQVLHDDEDEDVEEIDFKFHNNISTSIVRKYLDDYVSKNYNGKIVKVYYH